MYGMLLLTWGTVIGEAMRELAQVITEADARIQARAAGMGRV